MMILEDDSSISDGEDSNSDDQFDMTLLSNGSTVDELILESLWYGQYLYSPLWDPSIVWGRQLQVKDISEASCIQDFRFCCDHLQTVFNSLWPRLRPFLVGYKDCITCINRYTCL